MPTQRERAITVLKHLAALPPPPENLASILAEAQSRPPDGQADGSLSEQDWYALRDVCEAKHPNLTGRVWYALELLTGA